MDPIRYRSEPPVIASSWDDLLADVATADQWPAHRAALHQRYLDLLRDEQKPAKPPLDLQVHDEVVVDGTYRRLKISYAVEADERANAYLGLPLGTGPWPAAVGLHGTYPQGKELTAGLEEKQDHAYLDHLCRRGYVVIGPEHFVCGERTPAEGPYETARFHAKHPDWTAVGKFTYEHSIALDVLHTLPEVRTDRIGCLGHSLGGHGSLFLAAYDPRIAVAVSNCSATFFRHNKADLEWARNRWYVYFQHLRAGMLDGRLPPIDFHEIMALVAPRPFLELFGLNDGDPLTQRQRVLMMLKVMDVYDLVGAPANLAFYVHGQGHVFDLDSRSLAYAWLDKHLKG